jgi:hypothetical protein
LAQNHAVSGPFRIRKPLSLTAAWLALLLLAGGCSSISTPLPPTGKIGSTMSPQQTKEAIEELSHKRDTAMQDAETNVVEQTGSLPSP